MSNASKERRVLITGAGGFIGGWVAEILHLEGKWHVRAGVRRWASASRIARFPMEIVLCDVKNPASLDAAMSGVTDIVHCATGDAPTIIDGTRNVLDAALKFNARVIHLSSITVYGRTPGNCDEDVPVTVGDSEYSRAKIESEKLCAEFQARGVRTLILRPSIVYGPYSTLWTTNVALRLLTGKWGNLGRAGEGTCNLVYVQDLVRAIQCALENDNISGQAFNINGNDRITWNQYFETFNEMLELPQLRPMRVSAARWKSRLLYPARCFGKFMLNNHRDILIGLANRSRRMKVALKSAEATMRASPTADQLDLYKLQASYPTDKAQRWLGYRPAVDFQAGLDLSCAWLKHTGMI